MYVDLCFKCVTLAVNKIQSYIPPQAINTRGVVVPNGRTPCT
jgi:hypothetical protein